MFLLVLLFCHKYSLEYFMVAKADGKKKKRPRVTLDMGRKLPLHDSPRVLVATGSNNVSNSSEPQCLRFYSQEYIMQ